MVGLQEENGEKNGEKVEKLEMMFPPESLVPVLSRRMGQENALMLA